MYTSVETPYTPILAICEHVIYHNIRNIFDYTVDRTPTTCTRFYEIRTITTTLDKQLY